MKINKLKKLAIFNELENHYPDAHCALNFRNPFELLVATILSAQCTDKRVNMVTPQLFARFTGAAEMAEADLNELETLIKSTGFFRQKSKNIKGAAMMIVDKFDGLVPREMNQLLLLPGVARKTANVVLWNAYGINEGVVVDTHVKRTSKRLGWTESENVLQIERDLMNLLPKEKWGKSSHLLIELGREFCKAPRPNCEKCFLKKLCRFNLVKAGALRAPAGLETD